MRQAKTGFQHCFECLRPFHALGKILIVFNNNVSIFYRVCLNFETEYEWNLSSCINLRAVRLNRRYCHSFRNCVIVIEILLNNISDPL